MSKGCLVFAFNNEQIDYIKQAKNLAVRAKTFLDLKTTVVTDVDIQDEVFDKVIIVKDKSYTTKKTYRNGTETSKLSFKNSNRIYSYDLSPYNETLILDSDVIICNKDYKKCFETKKDILLFKNAFDICTHRKTDEFDFVSNTGCEFYWATCVYFKKNKNTKTFFELLHHIYENYTYYKQIYQIPSNVYRNDFAFSIAIHMLNNFQQGNFVGEFPGTLYYSIDRDIVKSISDKEILLLTEFQNKHIPVKLKNTNLHCMNKFALEELL